MSFSVWNNREVNMPRPIGDGPGTGGGFISKPARGWPHPDQLITKEGITYAVRVSLNMM